MKVGVLGLWHLGSVTAACLAAGGIDVIAVDENRGVIHAFETEGRPSLFEPGLAELVAEARGCGRLAFSTDLSALSQADVLWVCHDTPVDDDDQADSSFVFESVKRAFPYLRGGAVVLVSSQLPAGSVAALERAFADVAEGRVVRFACSPENLRLGVAIQAFRDPERIIVGVRDDETRAVLEPLLARFCDRLIWMSVESAEMAKHALNSFLAVSVTFANELAAICERVGANAVEVEAALRSERRIGPHAYIRPGGAFAGGTLARDVQYLCDMSTRLDVKTPLLSSVIPSNLVQRGWAFRQIRERLPMLPGQKIAVLGLAYKPGTDTLRRSNAIETVRALVAAGATVRAYDPAVRELPDDLRAAASLESDVHSALAGAAVVVVATDWPEFRELKAEDFAALTERLILDPSRTLAPEIGADSRFDVISIGGA